MWMWGMCEYDYHHTLIISWLQRMGDPNICFTMVCSMYIWYLLIHIKYLQQSPELGPDQHSCFPVRRRRPKLDTTHLRMKHDGRNQALLGGKIWTIGRDFLRAIHRAGQQRPCMGPGWTTHFDHMHHSYMIIYQLSTKEKTPLCTDKWPRIPQINLGTQPHQLKTFK